MKLIGKHSLVPRRCFRLIVAGCERRDRLPSRGGASSRGVVGFNSGFGHRAHVLSVLGGDGMAIGRQGFLRAQGALGGR